jgi:glycerophosphoryl diester phosphodiesterase
MKDQIAWLTQVPIAHRGLHEPGTKYPENSLPAFERAIKKGYAIELDVQLSLDKTILVFHDENLKRMCDFDYNVCDLQRDQLNAARLAKSDHKIPTLDEVLLRTGGRVPLLIEVKHWVKVNNDLHRIVNTLLPYRGPYAIQSFNPKILGWFYKNAPHIPRGQLAGSFKHEPMNAFIKYLLRRCRLNFISKPHFLSYEAVSLSQEWIQHKRRAGVPVLGWTINTPQAYQEVSSLCDNIIFEGFMPPKVF